MHVRTFALFAMGLGAGCAPQSTPVMPPQAPHAQVPAIEKPKSVADLSLPLPETQIDWLSAAPIDEIYAWSSNERWLAVSLGGSLSVLDVSGSSGTSIEKSIVLMLPARGERRWGGLAAFSPDNGLLAWAKAGRLSVYATADWHVVFETNMDDASTLVFRSPNEIVTREATRFCRWAVPAGTALGCTKVVPSQPGSSDDGASEAQINAVSSDLRVAQIWALGSSTQPYEVWNVQRNELIAGLSEHECARVSNATVAISDRKTISLVDVATGKRIKIAQAVSECQMELSPDGHWLAVILPKKGVDLFDARTGKRAAHIKSDIAGSVQFEGNQLRVSLRKSWDTGRPEATLDKDVVWDLKAQKELHFAVPSRGFRSFDGRSLARRNSDGALQIMDVAAGTARTWTARPHADAIAMDPDGKALAFTAGNRLHFVSLSTGRFESLPLAGDARLEMRGEWLAAAVDKTMHLWRCPPTNACAALSVVPFDAKIRDLAFSVDTTWVHVAAGNSVVRVRTRSGERVDAVDIGGLAIALSQDGRFGLSQQPASEEKADFLFDAPPVLVRRWDLVEKKASPALRAREPVYAAVLPDGESFLLAPPTEHCGAGTPFTNVPALLRRRPPPWTCGSDVVRFHVQTGLDIRRYFDNGPIALSGDGQYVAIGSSARLLAYDVLTGVEKTDLEGARQWIVDAAASYAGTRVAAASADGSILVWHAQLGTLDMILLPSRDPARLGMVALAPDGHVEILGDVRDELICRMGTHIIPFDRCAKEWETTGILTSPSSAH